MESLRSPRTPRKMHLRKDWPLPPPTPQYSEYDKQFAATLPRLLLPPPGPDGLLGRGHFAERSMRQTAELTEASFAEVAKKTSPSVGLQEMKVVIQDTVTSCIRSLEGIVRTHVLRTLEEDKMGTVQDLVVHSITEEVLRTTTETAKELTRRELGLITSDLRSLALDYRSTESDLKAHREETRLQNSKQDKRVTRCSEDTDVLRTEIQELRRMMAALETKNRDTATEAKRRDEINSAISPLARDFRLLAEQHTELERSLKASFCTPQELQAATDESLETSRGMVAAAKILAQESHEHLLTGPLTTVQNRLMALENVADELTARAKEALMPQVDAVRSQLAEFSKDVARVYVRNDRVVELLETVDVARASTEDRLGNQIAKVKKEAAPAADVERELTAWRAERDLVSEAFRASQEEVMQQQSGLTGMLEQVDTKMSTYYNEFRTSSLELHKHGQALSLLSETAKKLQEEIGVEKRKVDAFTNQQQHNRKEMNYFSQRLNELESFESTVKKHRTQTDAVEQRLADAERRLQEVRAEVAAPTEAVAPVHASSRDQSRELDTLRSSISDVKQEIQILSASVSALTSHWISREQPPSSMSAQDVVTEVAYARSMYQSPLERAKGMLNADASAQT